MYETCECWDTSASLVRAMNRGWQGKMKSKECKEHNIGVEQVSTDFLANLGVFSHMYESSTQRCTHMIRPFIKAAAS